MEQSWDQIIKSTNKWYELNLKEIFDYKDLIKLFIKRNFSTRYKQTILGQAWLFINPLFSMVCYTIVFGRIAGLSTDGVPKPLFYLSSNILWGFFAACLTQTSATFTGNAGIFGKVYFPRMVSPISTVMTAFLDFAIQFLLFITIAVIYILYGQPIQYTIYVIMLPLLLLELALLGMGCGIIVSAATTKYRDLCILVGFGMTIWMYASPVIYSLELVPEQFIGIYMLNPVTPVLLTFRYAIFGVGTIPWTYLGISWIITLIMLFIGMVVFNKVEKTFMDTV